MVMPFSFGTAAHECCNGIDQIAQVKWNFFEIDYAFFNFE